MSPDTRPVRVRFCPSPTGNPHVGMLRTALFNWAYARHTGGTFIFRIEDTDAARDSESSYQALVDALRWLHLDWDEGPEVGGPHAPYRQSQRMDIYADVEGLLRAGGYTYDCYCTPEELEAGRERAKLEKRPPGYEGTCRNLTADQVAAHVAAGRSFVVRFTMPQQDTTWDDLVRGPITFPAGQVPDYVIVRANGEPLYTLVNPVDDIMMGVTHVLRGEDLLSSTPRQLAMYQALHAVGIGDGVLPELGHLPYVMGEGNKKLSKRDPESSLSMYVEQGYLPEGLTNYLALLGWSLSEDRDRFSLAEMVEAFDISRVNPSPARFDIKKCTALNADWIRTLSVDDLVGRLEPLLERAGLLTDRNAQHRNQQQALVRAAVPLVQERIETLSQAVTMLSFLLVNETDFVPDEADAAKLLTEETRPTLIAARDSLSGLIAWEHASIESALRLSLVDGLGLKPKNAFGPVRVAVTGRRVSPPLFESLELLGRDRSLARINRSLQSGA
ncbi:MAG TPA: glutamate--tRNA ligase [Actinomycetes bacterium]|nr:glutamate--tRNA ligase [Actinomycetes bacterium]